MFDKFRLAVDAQVQWSLNQPHLFTVNVRQDELYELYLSCFTDKSIYRKKLEHECSACKKFFQSFGNVVAIVENKMISFWDIPDLPGDYAVAAAALSALVNSREIKGVFRTKEATIGLQVNFQLLTDGNILSWTHLSASNIPSRFIVRPGHSVEAETAPSRTAKELLLRGLETLTIDATEVVLDLISQNSLYRGAEFKGLLESFLKLQKTFVDLSPEEQEFFLWHSATTLSPAVSGIRNTAIGSLLIDLSDEVDVDEAVRKFEAVVAPTNYKRSKPVFTESMLTAAKSQLEALGFLESLDRRFATADDLNIGNVLFMNAGSIEPVQEGDVFQQMATTIPAKSKNFHGVEEVPIERFLQEVLPRASAIEVLLESRHSGNLASLIAPKNPDSPSMFKWENGFSWAYAGNITDSMKERVKAAGGDVEGVLRFSIQWNESGNNRNDFDAHCLEPNGHLIYYTSKGKLHPSSGMLDVDIIDPEKAIAVENITYSSRDRMPDGVYNFLVHNYNNRGGTDGFRAEVEFDGVIYSFDHPEVVKNGDKIPVAQVVKKGGAFTIRPFLTEAKSTRSLWGKQVNQFHPVSVIMRSPNHWDEQSAIGNSHLMFFIQDCISDESPNGFFNEFLRSELIPHRKVLEALGTRMKVQDPEPRQLSGLAFSSTKRDSLTCRIKGKSNRIIKVVF